MFHCEILSHGVRLAASWISNIQRQMTPFFDLQYKGLFYSTGTAIVINFIQEILWRCNIIL